MINTGRILLLTAFLLRIWTAWAWRDDLHHDRGRAALMALHMAHSTDATAFAYGAPQLGSLEPALASLFFRLFGYHEFLLNLATALIGFLVLPIVYRWTRETGGRLAGLIALACLIAGPYPAWVFTVLPRGGSALTLLLFSALLWLTGNLVRRETPSAQHAPVWMYHAFGVLLGLSWWTNQILFAASITAVARLFAALRFRLFNRRMLYVTILFFLTSAPWWLWNLFNRWESFSFLPALFPSALRTTHWTPFFRRMLQLFLLPSEWGVFAWTGPIILTLTLLGSVPLFIHAVRTRRSFPGWIHLGITLSFLPVFALCYSASAFAGIESLRSLIIIAPVFALLFGCCSAWLFHRMRRRWLAILPLIILMLGDTQSILQSRNNNDNPLRRLAALQIADYCQSNQVEVVFVHRWLHWMNAATQERMLFCDAEAEPYAPYEMRGNQADRVALLDDIFRLSDFLRASDAGWTSTPFGPFTLMSGFTNPPAPALPIPSEKIERISNPNTPDNLAPALSDQDCDTSWISRVDATGTVQHLTITLKKPAALSGIRLWCNNDRYPGICAVEGRSQNNAAWHPLLPPINSTPFFWSGPRWYINGLFYRMMYRWPATEPLHEIRVSFPPPAQYGYDIDLAELQLLCAETNPPPTPSTDDFTCLLQLFSERHIVRCFADRWLSAKIRDASGGRVETIMPAFTNRSVHSGERRITNEYYDITRFSPKDSLLVAAPEAPNLADLLQRCRLPMRQTPVGSWILFDFAPGTFSRETAFYPGLKWVGFGALSNHRRNQKFRGHYDYQEALDTDDPQLRLDYLKEAVMLYPRHKDALRALADLSHLRGDQALYRATQEALDTFAPELDLPIRYPNGLTLLGITPARIEAAPGESPELIYFWECPPAVQPDHFAVFVHFDGQGRHFQDDHVLLENIEPSAIAEQLTPETFITRRVFQVPEGIPPGDYPIAIGVYNRRTSFRLTPDTKLKTHGKAAVLPLTITILPDSQNE